MAVAVCREAAGKESEGAARRACHECPEEGEEEQSRSLAAVARRALKLCPAVAPGDRAWAGLGSAGELWDRRSSESTKGSVTPWARGARDRVSVPPWGHRRRWRCTEEKPELCPPEFLLPGSPGSAFPVTAPQGHGEVALPLRWAPARGQRPQ